MSAIVALYGVTRRYVTLAETVVAVDDVSFLIEPGELMVLAGPSGSGKSTTLHLVVGLDVPDTGEVVGSDGLPGDWRGVAVVPQDLGLIGELTVRQNVELAARLAHLDAASVMELFDVLGLVALADRMPGQLSVWEQQRCAVARAAVCAPGLLVADEPTAHQDERHADAVMEVLQRVAARGSGVLVATHDERLLAQMDRVLRLEDGSLETPSAEVGADSDR